MSDDSRVYSWPVALEGEIGSVAHGLGTEKSDHDILRVVVEPATVLYGLEPEPGVQRDRPVPCDTKTPAGATETTIVTLRKFVSMVVSGHQTAWALLSTPILTETELYGARDVLRKAAISVAVVERISRSGRSMIYANLERYTEGASDAVPNKTVANGLRVLYQTAELCTAGKFPMPIPDDRVRDFLLGVRQGRVTRSEIEYQASRAASRVELKQEKLPENPDTGCIIEWMRGVYCG